MSRRFRKKPVVIEAAQMPDSTTWKNYVAGHTVSMSMLLDVSTLLANAEYTESAAGIHIETLEGTMTASPGDWIIKGVKGECYPCKPDIFEATYESAED